MTRCEHFWKEVGSWGRGERVYGFIAECVLCGTVEYFRRKIWRRLSKET